MFRDPHNPLFQEEILIILPPWGIFLATGVGPGVASNLPKQTEGQGIFLEVNKAASCPAAGGGHFVAKVVLVELGKMEGN